LYLIVSLVVGSLVVLAVGVWLMHDAVSPPVAAAAQSSRSASLRSAPIERELRIEKDKVANLSRELALAQRDIEAQVAMTADRQALAQEGTVLRKALRQMGTEAAATEEALAQERARNRELEGVLRQRSAPAPVPAPVPVETTETKQQPEVRMSEKSSMPEAAADSSDVARLMTRARQLLEQGDIGSARAVLERASELGSGPALFALAETYNPVSLATWGTSGTQGDPVKAKSLYAQALASGVTEAKGRLETLDPQPKEPAK
jgi:hypothetical protein